MPEKTLMGKIVREGEGYALEMEGQRHPLPDELVALDPEFGKLLDQEVEVLLSEPKSFVVALRKIGRPPILCYMPPDWLWASHWLEVPYAALKPPRLRPRPTCYIPAPWIIRGIEDQVRKNLADQMLKDGVISKEVHAKLLAR